jgi:hypothetical protein
MSPVHLIYQCPDGKRLWFSGIDRKVVNFRWATIPRFDDEAKNSLRLDLEFARTAQRRFREDLNIETKIARTPDGEIIEENEPTVRGRDGRVPMFVFTNGDKEGYLVIPVNLATGPAWCLRFENSQLANQPVFASSPEAAVEKARTMGFLKIEKPQPSPFKKQEQPIVVERTSTLPPGARVRPGDAAR